MSLIDKRIMVFITKWKKAKAEEEYYKELRRNIEDRILKLVTIKGNSLTIDTPINKLKITTRMDEKVDSDKLQEIAAENGLTDHLSDLFRWKPAINKTVWKATDKSIAEILEEAITVKPGRASFTLTEKE